MGASKDLFIKLSEEEYFAIPEDVRKAHITGKVYSESIQDFDTLMQDENYRNTYKTYWEVKKDLEELTYQIRERNRANSNNK